MRLALVFLVLGVATGCNTAPTYSKNWPELSRRHLPGTWTSDKAGQLSISCQGYINLDDRGNFDLSNTGLKNAKIVELGESDLVIETMPLIKEHYAMDLYPYEEKGEWKMKFWNRAWTKVEERDCDSPPGN